MRILLTLHETGNVSRTAREMAITQPALSKWLKELEQDLGVSLFTRHSKGLVPTRACDLLAERSRLLLTEFSRTAELLDALKDGVEAKLHVGTTPTGSTEVIPASIAEMAKHSPRTLVVLREGPIDFLLPQLKDGRLDLLVTVLEDRDYGAGIAQHRLYREQMVIVAGASHALQEEQQLTWAEVASYSWVGAPKDSLVYRELMNEFALANQPLPQFVGDISSSVVTSNVLWRTDSLAMMSRRSALMFERAGLIRILKLPLQRQLFVGVLWRKESRLSEPRMAFFQCLRDACLRLSEGELDPQPSSRPN
jgi:DNA-binding transcriptional LysR family regulator